VNDSGGWMIAFAAIVPLVVLMLTSFVKVSIVLALLRNAIGSADAPSGLIVMGIALVLTFFVMAPVAVDVVTAASAAPPTPAGIAPPGTAPTGTAPTGTAPTRSSPGAGSSTQVAGSQPTGSPTPPGAPQDAPTGAAPGTSPTVTAPTGTAPATGSGAGPNTQVGGTQPTGAPAPSPTGAPQTGGPSPTDAPTTTRPVDVEAAVRKLAGPGRQADIDRAVRGLEPIRGFLEKHASERDRQTFQATSQKLGRATTGKELWVLAPAFLATELREAFAIAVVIFIPFLVIDLIVGLALAALGLTNMSPQSIALPIKLLLFVAVDGWRLLLDSLLRGYA